MNKISITKINLLNDKKKVNRSINLIKKEFLNSGIIEFSNLPFKKNEIQTFTDFFTTNYANDANRRINKFKDTKINTVDLGNHSIPIHSEASFSYSYPEIIWFYCYKNDKNGAPTTICDGKDLWQKLNKKTKQFFLKNPIKYEVQIDIPFKKKKNLKQEYFVNKIGVFNSHIDWKKSKFNFSILKYAVNEDKNSDALFFSNHIFVGSKNEKQIKNVKLVNDKSIPKNIMKEIIRISRKLTFKYNWKKNILLMIDNKRFMHGRDKFKKNSVREILNIQTLKSNFL